jgi:hypothetical protein
MKRVARRGLVAFAVVLACLPAAFVVTLLLMPLWSWIEATYGIEAVGHSGPSDWCFWAVFGVMLATATALLFKVGRSRAT